MLAWGFFQHYIIYIFGHYSWAQNVHNQLLALMIQLLLFVTTYIFFSRFPQNVIKICGTFGWKPDLERDTPQETEWEGFMLLNKFKGS